MKRYQECNRFEKLLRKRWKLIVPFVAAYYYVTRKKVYMDVNVENGIMPTKHFEYMTLKLCWRVAQGDAGSKMNHYYTQEEVMERFKDKFNIEEDDEDI